jgi:hypothetical protein
VAVAVEFSMVQAVELEDTDALFAVKCQVEEL